MQTKNYKPMPILHNDDEVEDFVANCDLTDYDPAEFKPFKFELEKKDKALYMRLPTALADEIKSQAKKRGLPYQRYIRSILEEAMHKEAAREAAPKAA